MSEKLCTLRTKGGGGGATQTETVLWTNSSPSSNFGWQEVTLSSDIDDFDYIKFDYKANTEVLSKISFVVSVTELKTTLNTNNSYALGLDAYRQSSGNLYIMDRSLYLVNDTTIHFNPCRTVNATQTNDAWCIPLSIIGIKNMGGYASIKDYAFMFATSDSTRSVNRGYTSNSSVFTVAKTGGSSATNTITVLEAGNYEYMAETGNRSTANCYVKIGEVAVSVGTTTSAAGNIYIQANTVCTVYTAPASSSINTATLTLIKK